MKTFFIAIALSLVAVIWSWNYYLQANTNHFRSQAQFKSCKRLATEISRKCSQTAIAGIAPPNYDYAKNLMRLLGECRIATDRGVSLAGSRIVISDGGVVKKAVFNPISQSVSLVQVIELLSAADRGDIRYYVEAIELTAPTKKPTAQETEQWTVSDFELSFFEADEIR